MNAMQIFSRSLIIESPLNGHSIMDHIQNPYEEYEWDFYFLSLTVKFC